MSTATESNQRKPLQGTQTGQVVSDQRDKTIKVMVEYLKKDPKYGKYIKRRSSFQVHDPKNEASNGDTVEIAPCRPISKTKSWRLVRITEKAPGGKASEGATSA